LGGVYLQMQQTNQAVTLFDEALGRPEIKFPDAQMIAQHYAELGNLAKLETAVKTLVRLAPDQPESRYDLAALQAYTGQSTEALQNLKIALDLSAQRLAKDPKARDLVTAARTDPRLERIRSLPEFQKILPAK
jgi:tetratricopeptide (TPR) repeat protein